MKFYRLRLLLLLCLAWIVLFTPRRAAAQANLAFTKQAFVHGGERIRVDVYDPPASYAGRRKSAIVVLHGAGGMLFDGPEIRRIASRLALDGHPAYVVHYFNQTCTIAARDAVLRKNFETWLPTVRAAISWVTEQQPRHGRKSAAVGIYGYSLGAFLAVTASSNNPQISALAEQAGGVWNNVDSRLGKMPPVLMLHGRADQRVPFNQYALPLLAVLHRRGAKVETHFFPGEGHRFSTSAQAQARDVIVKYFADR